MNVPIYRMKGARPGPTVYIQSSIHGAEVQGNVVIYHLIQRLKDMDICGEIILVPNCNPIGTNIKAGEYTLGRFDPVNGTNWNRGYFFDKEAVEHFAKTVTREESIEGIKQRFRAHLSNAIDNKLAEPWGLGLAQQLNLKLQQMAVNADFVLDLHNGPVSTRHVYIPEYAKDSAKLVYAMSVAKVPRLSVLLGGSYGAGNYGMCGRGFAPNFLFAWPTAELATMSADIATNVMLELRRQKGGDPGKMEADMKLIEEQVRAQYGEQSDPYYATSRLWDDGLIEPAQTRDILGLCLAIVTSVPEAGRHTPVFRM